MKQHAMRTYISPIGYDSTRVTRPVLSRGLDTNDRIVLLRPATEANDSRADQAIEDVSRLLAEIEPEIDTTVEYITHDDLPTAVLECSDVLLGADGTIIVNLGGGARDVFLPFTIATLAHVGLIDAVLTFSDIDGTVREWDLPDLTADVSDATIATLIAIEEAGRVSVTELAEQSGQAKSTVARHVSQLADSGAVIISQDGKTKYARLSLTGRLLLRSHHQ